jgi:hypothetical protein
MRRPTSPCPGDARASHRSRPPSKRAAASLPGATLVELRTLETTETSVTTRLPISGSALLFGGFVVQVRDGDGATIGCTELGR